MISQTIGERIKLLRKEKGLTLDQFGDRVGIKKSGLSQIERGINNLTDQMALSICREFNVNEEWLRTGEGKMYAERSADEQVQQWVERALAGRPEDIKRRLLSSLPRISSAGWEALELLLQEVERIMMEDAADEPEDTADIDEEVEEYRRQLLIERGQADVSSVFGDSAIRKA